VHRPRATVALIACLALAGFSFPALACEAARPRTDTLSYGRFGRLVLYRDRAHPSRVALLVSGAGGWDRALAAMAHDLAASDALIVGIDLPHYLHSTRSTKSCFYPAGDFEALSQWAQQRLGFPAYITPVLLGDSLGATLVHAILTQAPPGTFRGGLGLAFRPSLSLARPLCHVSDSLSAPWVALDTGPQLRGAFTRLASTPTATMGATPPALPDLPLIELRPPHPSRRLAVVITGDGGWASIDRQIGETLAAGGIPVVGLNSLSYFWKARTPDQAGADLTRLLRHYIPAWNTSRLILVGYSRGADVLPFMVTRLPADLRNRIDVVALLGLSPVAGFEFHFADLLGGKPSGLPTVPEIRRLRGLRILCVYGTDETDSACPALPAGLASLVAVPGGHHFAGAYRDVARRILEDL
jgi:type IV secretory pathway VirJ component